jgi:YYY domain-containing protein
MAETIRWWLVLLVAGAVSLPLCLALFRRLPDRGYALSKPFGLILLGYLFWLLNSVHILPNSARGIVAALILIGLLSAWFAWREHDALRAWLGEHWRYILAVECCFFAVFAVAVWLRSFVGTIDFTEQPMDLMYVNAASAADHFPPKDPWLSGYDVAYYYFGYLLVAMTGKLSGEPPEVAYNLGFAATATMALVGCAGVVFNLVRMREEATAGEAPATTEEPASARRARQREAKAQKQKTPRRSRRAIPAGERGSLAFSDVGANWPWGWRAPLFGLAGGLVLVVAGNLSYVLTYMSIAGIGGKGFYDWFNISGLTADEPSKSIGPIPYPSDNFGFFDASRIYPLDHAGGRVITEFPMFSFVLGDLHPHVMALPFVVLVVGLALALFRSREPLDIVFWIQRPLALVAAAVLVGALTFLNTWDVGTLGFVVVAMAFISNFTRVRRVTLDLFVQAVTFAVPLVLLAFLLYLPFIISISGNSQANGIAAVVANRGVTVPATRPVHLLIFWGPLFAITVPFVLARLLPLRRRLTGAIALAAAAPAALIVVFWAVLFLYEKAAGKTQMLGEGTGSLFHQVAERGTGWWSAIGVAVVLTAALATLWLELTSDDDRPEREASLFALGLIATSMLLILGCEFFFVDDVFHSRMNTVFKLYYQAWALLAVASGFALYYLASRWRVRFPGADGLRWAWAALVVVALAGASLYPIGASANRSDGFAKSGKLDGLASLTPSDQAAIDWLRDHVGGQDVVIAEAVAGDYWTQGKNSRISMATGIPAVIGWKGHEDQWRSGACKPCVGRFEDVNALYSSADESGMRQIINKYGIAFIIVGDVERAMYGPQVAQRFSAFPVAFQQGTATIYRAGG